MVRIPGEASLFISVILSTYESPAWLEKVLWGYAAQTYRDFEVVVADDGSGPGTAACVERMRRVDALRLRHVWHEHRGFRKCAILNRAVAAATGEYLVFSDGDCVPRRDFVAQHARHAQPGYFLSGGLVRLPRLLSQRLTIDDITSGRATQLRWLATHGWVPSRKALLLVSDPLSGLLNAVTPTHPTFNGHNSSAWKSDVLRVNGFDERMGYGGLDREFGYRLRHAGVRPKQVRHSAVCVHLDHERNYVDPRTLERNAAIRRETLERRLTWTPYGIEQERPGGAAPPATSPRELFASAKP